MKTCLYCNKDKKDKEISKEHIIPRALGGNLTPKNPFSIDVCKRCNNVAGAYIDGPFLKNWLTKNNMSQKVLEYANIEIRPARPLPLTYWGKIPDLTYETKICDLWQDPTGGTIYHFHEPYPNEPDISTFAGKPTHLREKEIDPGFVIVLIRSNNPKWHPVIVASIVAQFEDSKIYLGNGPNPGAPFADIPSDLTTFVETAKDRARAQKSYNLKIAMDLGFGDRFLAKLALGIGSIFLNDSFKNSHSAKNLRDFMWEKDSEKRKQMSIIRNSFFDKSSFERLETLIKWDGGHTVMLIRQRDYLFLYIQIYETQGALFLISNEPEHWEGIIDGMGIVSVISPSLQKYIGDKENLRTLEDYIFYQTIKNDPSHNPNNLDPEFLNLENEVKNNIKLEPFMINETPEW